MARREERPIDINPDKETADRNPLHMMPGGLEETETASARESRTGSPDITGAAARRRGTRRRDIEKDPRR